MILQFARNSMKLLKGNKNTWIYYDFVAIQNLYMCLLYVFSLHILDSNKRSILWVVNDIGGHSTCWLATNNRLFWIKVSILFIILCY